MSTNLLKICSIIIEDNFGLTVKRVAETLIIIGPVRLSGIVSHSNVSQSDVKEALKILFQHNLLTFKTNEGFIEPFYRLKDHAALFIPRIPQFLATAEKRLGLECRQIVDEVARAGQITMSKLFYILGYKYKKENGKAVDNTLFERLVIFRNAVARTVERKYICICPVIASDPSISVPVFESNGAEAFVIPKVDLRFLCDKIIKKDSNIDSLPDASIFWKINVDQFHAELKNELLIEAVNVRCKAFVDKNMFPAILELGTQDQLFPCVSSPVTVQSVHAYLIKTEKAPPTLEIVKEHLELIEADSLRFLTKSSNNSFVVNMKNAFNHLIWTTIERTIQEKHGFFAARIFRIIKKLNFVEQDKINEIGMIPGKNAKELTYLLVEDNFITLKEIRKSYAVSAAAHKASLVFYVDLPQIVHTLVESCYKAMINLRLRIRIEKDRHARLVAKEDRIERILSNMINNDCSEEQLKEVRDMITPPERTVLNKYKAYVNKLTSAHLHVDHTLFVVQMHLLYSNLK